MESSGLQEKLLRNGDKTKSSALFQNLTFLPYLKNNFSFQDGQNAARNGVTLDAPAEQDPAICMAGIYRVFVNFFEIRIPQLFASNIADIGW